jgi:hypothetical protein
MTEIERHSVNDISENHLQALVTAKVAEGNRTLEFKQDLKIGTDSDKKEFCTDIVSFANAVGGLMLHGVRAENGVAIEIIGLSVIDADALVLQVEQILHTGISPRLPWVSIRAVQLANEKYVLAIKVPRSSIAPHAAGRDGVFRFFTRGANGKLPMDIPQVRSSFLLSEGLRDRLRSYRAERLGRIEANDGIVPLSIGSRLVVQIIPLISLAEPTEYDVAQFFPFQKQELVALGSQHASGREFNVDGIADIHRVSDTANCSGYTQLYQNGIIEAVYTDLVLSKEGGNDLYNNSIHAPSLHDLLIAGVGRFISIMKKLDVETPIFIMVSISGIKGTRMFFTNYNPLQKKCDRDSLVFPDIVITDYRCNVPEKMKPIFDALWRSFGAPKCPWYQTDGSYTPLR